MPIVGKKKYPYTTAGRAAAKKAAAGLGRTARRAPSATAKMKGGMKLTQGNSNNTSDLH